MLLGACADSGSRGPAVVVVAPQDTLYSIAWRYDLDYRDLARWNNLGTDYRISVGQKLFMSPGQAPVQQQAARQAQERRPVSPASTASPTLAPAPAASRGASAARADQPRVDRPIPLPEVSPTLTGTAAKTPTTQSKPADGEAKLAGGTAKSAGGANPRAGSLPNAASGSSTTANNAAKSASAPDKGDDDTARPLRWVWPTDRSGAPRPVPGGGILISGKLGQEVRAAAAGRVVYAGSGLRSYGKLVIIKHGDNLLSAYAHNRELEVREGQDVTAGQTIARMGEAVRQIPVLYFEIRLNGRPVDPEPYLLGKK